MTWHRCIAATLVLASASCGGSSVDLPPPPAAQPDATSAAPPVADGTTPRPVDPKQQRVILNWGNGWVIKVRPTFGGQPINDGAGTVTVDSWKDGPERVHYAFPKVQFLANQKEVYAASKGVLRPAPVEGTVTIDAKARAVRSFTPPAFWPGGQASSSGPLLWLPRAAYDELKTKRQTTLDTVPLPGGLLMATEKGDATGAATLTFKSRDAMYMLVNGQRLRLPVFRVEDDRGAIYVVLDTPDNPLVMYYRMGRETTVAGKRTRTGEASGYDVMGLDNPTTEK